MIRLLPYQHLLSHTRNKIYLFLKLALCKQALDFLGVPEYTVDYSLHVIPENPSSLPELVKLPRAPYSSREPSEDNSKLMNSELPFEGSVSHS